MKNITNDQCKDIIKEYDSNEDGTLSLDEFPKLMLPSTNSELRDACL